MNNKTNATVVDSSTSDHRRWQVGLMVILAIVLLGVASRFLLVGMPNFKPVAALILFGGFFLRKSWPVIVAVLLIMVISDLKLGGYHWALALSVYGSLALSGFLGVWIRRSGDSSTKIAGAPRVGLRQLGRFVGASLAMSTLFYLLTNGSVWWMGQWYPSSLSGLVDCYIAGLPFYRATLMGDLFFTGVIVGVYSLCHYLLSHLRASRCHDTDWKQTAEAICTRP